MLISFTALQIAFVLGGKVHGHGVIAPLPDHAPDDCSLSVMPNQAGDDYVVDPPACRAYVEEKVAAARAIAGPAKAKAMAQPIDWIEQELAAPIAPADLNGHSAPLAPNITDINNHLYTLFPPAFVHGYPDAGIEIAWGHPAYKDGAVNQARIFSAFDLEKVAAFAVKKNTDGCNVYIAPALRVEAHKSGRAKGEDVLTSGFAWCEFDKAGDADRVNQLCKAHMLWPAIIVTTGTTPDLRQQLYFPVDGVPTPSDLTTMGAALKALFGTDAVHNSDRVLRLAGSINWPSPDKIGRGYVPELTTLRMVPEPSRYSIEHLAGLGKPNGKTSADYFEAYGAEHGEQKPGRTDDEIVKLLEETRGAPRWRRLRR